jgi:hypothetical protein
MYVHGGVHVMRRAPSQGLGLGRDEVLRRRQQGHNGLAQRAAASPDTRVQRRWQGDGLDWHQRSCVADADSRCSVALER